MTDAESILKSCSLFQSVGAGALRRIVSMARLRTARKGSLIFRQGDPCPGIHVVGRGLVRIFSAAPSGKDHVLHMAGPGQSFAEVATIGNFACPAAAEATQATAYVLLPADTFRRALRKDHGLCLGIMKGMALRVRQLLGLLEDIVLRDAGGRLARFLLESAGGNRGDAVLPSLKRHLASHLNLTSETLSRTLRRLTDAGLIEARGGRRIRIVDPGGLRAISQGLFPLL